MQVIYYFIVFFFKEAQAQRHAAHNSTSDMQTSSPPQSSGEILNNVSTMEFQQATRVLSASFRYAYIHKITSTSLKNGNTYLVNIFIYIFAGICN